MYEGISKPSSIDPLNSLCSMSRAEHFTQEWKRVLWKEREDSI